MKKTLALVLMLLAITASCAAFTPPDPDTWVTVIDNGRMGLWVNAKTVRFEKDGDGTCGIVLMLSYTYPDPDAPGTGRKSESDFYAIDEAVFQMEKKKWRSRRAEEYSADDGTLLYTLASDDLPPFSDFYSGSQIDAVYEFLRVIYESSAAARK